MAHASNRDLTLAVLLTLVTAGSLPAAAAEEGETQTIEERRLELERRELELEKKMLEFERERLGLEDARKNLAEEAAAREVITIQLQGEVLFDFGTTEIRPRSEPTLEKIAAVIRHFEGGGVTIGGHTDSIGDAGANLAISKGRAQAVRDWLVAKGGLDGARIEVEGHGETQPIAPNQRPDGSDDPQGRQKNRRVVIEIAEEEKRSPEVTAAMRALDAKETDEQLSIALQGDVLFDFGKATILPKAEDTLRKVATVLEAFPEGRVLVQGHTDAKGPPEANLALSKQRADAVEKWLVEKTRVAPGSIVAKGLGETEPVAPNENPDGSDNPEGRRQNRRVEIVVAK